MIESRKYTKLILDTYNYAINYTEKIFFLEIITVRIRIFTTLCELFSKFCKNTQI